MLVNIRYTCPVYVVVDTDEGTVERVVVDDENCYPDEPLDAVENTTLDFVPEENARRALAIAEGSDESSVAWPSWEFGW